MRYFFLAYAIIAVLFVGVMGFRGQKFHKPPVQVFPDMDNQDKLKAQAPSTFFADRQGDRLPVEETQPRGFNEGGEIAIGGIPEYEYGGQIGYYYTGHVGDYYGTGMPEELSLTTENAGELIRRGQERFGIYCAVCHGASGDGLGMTSRYGVPGIANLHGGPFLSGTYPDGRMFEVITKGKGQMGAYGMNIPVRDRWAVIAYVRTLQAAKVSADAAKKEAAESEAAGKEDEPPVGATGENQAELNPSGAVTQDDGDSESVTTPEDPKVTPDMAPQSGIDPADNPVEPAPATESEDSEDAEPAEEADQ